MSLICKKHILSFVLQRCRAWLERAKYLWHPSVLLTWLCIWAQFNHCNPLPPIMRWLILSDWDLLSSQIIALHYHVIPSCKRRIKMFSVVRYFYPPTSPSVNYSKYSYIKIKPSVNWQSAAGSALWHISNGYTITVVLPPHVFSHWTYPQLSTESWNNHEFLGW